MDKKASVTNFSEITSPHDLIAYLMNIADEIYIIGFPFGRIGGSGMSGSPVVLYQKRPTAIIENDRLSKHFTKLVGIYSGRIGANTENKNDAQLGRVWKAEVIDEMIAFNEK